MNKGKELETFCVPQKIPEFFHYCFGWVRGNANHLASSAKQKGKKHVRLIVPSSCLIERTTTEQIEYPEKWMAVATYKRTKLIISRRSIQSSQKSSSSTFVAQCHPFYLSLARSLALAFRHTIHLICLETSRRHANIDRNCFFSSIHFACSAPVSLFLSILPNGWLLAFVISVGIYWLISWFVPFIVEMLLFSTLFLMSHQVLHMWLLKCQYQLHTKPRHTISKRTMNKIHFNQL